MEINNQIIHTLYKSSKCDFTIINDYKSVYCKNKISEGDILLIEHCFYQKKKNSFMIANALRFQEYIFNELYPRKDLWSENFALDIPPKSIIDLIGLKVQKNSFKEKNHIIIGNDISYFNHSDIPNACITKEEVILDNLDINCIVIIVVATTKIKPKNEIFIKYSDKIDFENNLHIPQIKFTLNYKKIKLILNKYIKTYTFKLIIRNQLANHHGLFMTNNIIIPTKRFITYLKDVCKIDIINHEDPITIYTKWLDYTYNNIDI